MLIPGNILNQILAFRMRLHQFQNLKILVLHILGKPEQTDISIIIAHGKDRIDLASTAIEAGRKPH
jgi:hypothetical protein